MIDNNKKSSTMDESEKNVIQIKQGDYNHVWKSPVIDNCTDFWVIHHYKMKDIQNKEACDR